MLRESYNSKVPKRRSIKTRACRPRRRNPPQVAAINPVSWFCGLLPFHIQEFHLQTPEPQVCPKEVKRGKTNHPQMQPAGALHPLSWHDVMSGSPTIIKHRHCGSRIREMEADFEQRVFAAPQFLKIFVKFERLLKTKPIHNIHAIYGGLQVSLPPSPSLCPHPLKVCMKMQRRRSLSFVCLFHCLGREE